MSRGLLFALVGTVLLAGACAYEAPPTEGAHGPRASLWPASAGRGMALSVSVLGQHTRWDAEAGALDVDFGAGVRVRNVVVEDSGLLVLRLEISATAELGHRDVHITGPLGSLVVEDGFLVQTGGFVLSPNRAPRGQELWIEVYGTGTNFVQSSTYAAIGTDADGIDIRVIDVFAPDRLRLRVNVGIAAEAGLHDVFIYTGPEVWTLAGGFQVDRSGIRLSLWPPTARQGETVAFQIDAVGSHFVQADSQVLLDHLPCLPTTCQVRPLDLEVVDAETIRGSLQVSNAARLGLRDLVVSTGEEILRLPDAFDVLAGRVDCRESARGSAWFGINRSFRSDGSLRERVDASVVFSVPQDPPCQPVVSGGGPVSPYDAPSAYDSPSADGRCPPSPTCDAGPFVHLFNDEQSIALRRYYDPLQNRYWYGEAETLTLGDFRFDTYYGLRADGSVARDAIPAFEVAEVLRTVTADWELYEPDLSQAGLTWSQDEPLPVRWTLAYTHPQGRLTHYLQTAPADGVGRPRYGILVPWDDGEWIWEPPWLHQLPAGPAFLSMTGSSGSVIWRLPFQTAPLASYGSSSLRWYGYGELVD
jgi:hypothetical protein